MSVRAQIAEVFQPVRAAVQLTKAKKVPTCGVPVAPIPVAPFQPAKTIEEAEAWAEKRRVYFVAGEKMTLAEWNVVNQEVAKISKKVLSKLKLHYRRLELVKGRGVTLHPRFTHLKGRIPRGWSGRTTWDDVAGISSPDGTVVVVNKLQGTQCANVLLHEHAHTFDRCVKVGKYSWSNQNKWQKIWKNTAWDRAYFTNYSSEAFAESFAKYFHSAETRAALPKIIRDYFAVWE